MCVCVFTVLNNALSVLFTGKLHLVLYSSMLDIYSSGINAMVRCVYTTFCLVYVYIFTEEPPTGKPWAQCSLGRSNQGMLVNYWIKRGPFWCPQDASQCLNFLVDVIVQYCMENECIHCPYKLYHKIHLNFGCWEGFCGC